MDDLFSNLITGFSVAIQPQYLLYGLLGAALGTTVGVLPGLGTSVTIALLLPLTFQIGDPIGAFILFGGIYYGAAYGGSTTSILIRTPGESDSIIAALDGHEMARNGRAGAALTTAAMGSFIAGTIATLGLMSLAVPLVSMALLFGPSEYFALMLLASSVVVALGGKPRLAVFSAMVGLALGTVGIDFQSGQTRFTFGVPGLFDGISFVVAAVGLFALSEVFIGLGRLRSEGRPRPAVIGKLRMTRDETRRSIQPWFRGSILGFLIGVLPGLGASVATFFSYGLERALSKPAVPFGKGAIEGLAGPEAANNASSGGAMVPLLFLGIPGSATTAVMLAGLQGHGLPTGPLLLQQHGDLVWAVIASLYIGNAMLLILNLPMIGLWVKVLRVPHSLLYPVILAVSVTGVYSLRHSVLDLVTMFIFGIVGLVFRRIRIPVAPLILMLILGPLMETQLRRAITASNGDWTILFSRPISATILALALSAFVLPVLLKLFRRRLESPAASNGRSKHDPRLNNNGVSKDD